MLGFELVISQQLVQVFTKSIVRGGLHWTEINAALINIIKPLGFNSA